MCFTHPHIGNVGINFEDNESEKCWMKGCIVRDHSIKTSNYRARMDLDAYFKEQGVVGIADVDTRKLTKILRNYGCLNGALPGPEEGGPCSGSTSALLPGGAGGVGMR